MYAQTARAYTIADACLRCQTDGKQEECVGKFLLTFTCNLIELEPLYSCMGRVQPFLSQLLYAALDQAEQ